MFDIQERTTNPNNYFIVAFGRSEWRMLEAPHEVDLWQQRRHTAYGM